MIPRSIRERRAPVLATLAVLGLATLAATACAAKKPIPAAPSADAGSEAQSPQDWNSPEYVTTP